MVGAIAGGGCGGQLVHGGFLGTLEPRVTRRSLAQQACPVNYTPPSGLAT